MAQSRRREPSLYIGVDVGGTKVLAALVQSTGEIVARHRCPTPRDASPEATVEAIMQAMEGALADQGLTSKALKGIGLTIPGVVDPAAGHIVVTPNMNLTGITIGPLVTQRFGVPVVIGNDVNMGTLGEKWLGAARRARSAVGIMVGTGIGGGVIVDGKLVTGCREAAGEIGHMVVQIGGPQCGCGNYGCLEALASRTAIERDIRQAIADGKQTLVEDLLKETDGLVKSSVLRKALKAGDKVVTQIMQRASEVLGYGCLTVRHLLDPDVIVLGGGVIEACGRFVLPIVRGIVASDALAGARPGSYIAESERGDDAVVYGAVALAMTECGEDPSE
ncbi:MAG: ROK family protein, partial [Candidatus Brocadiae bacterium]|nr:ROK family protein [Candidatus Brocadiia bacterium]